MIQYKKGDYKLKEEEKNIIFSQDFLQDLDLMLKQKKSQMI